MELTTRNNSGQVDRKCFNMNSFFSFKIVLMVAYFIVITGGIVTTYRTFHLENVDIPEVSNSQEKTALKECFDYLYQEECDQNNPHDPCDSQRWLGQFRTLCDIYFENRIRDSYHTSIRWWIAGELLLNITLFVLFIKYAKVLKNFLQRKRWIRNEQVSEV